jgi:hypothetical protein
MEEYTFMHFLKVFVAEMLLMSLRAECPEGA